MINRLIGMGHSEYKRTRFSKMIIEIFDQHHSPSITCVNKARLNTMPKGTMSCSQANATILTVLENTLFETHGVGSKTEVFNVQCITQMSHIQRSLNLEIAEHTRALVWQHTRVPFLQHTRVHFLPEQFIFFLV